MRPLILAIDQGTTGTTAILIDEDLNVYGKVTANFSNYFPKPLWVEHDLNEIWASVGKSIKELLLHTSTDPKQIVALGITNQRETTCLWHRDEKATPVGRALVWQDRRTAALCDKYRKYEKNIIKKTGLILDPYFSASKMMWFIKENPSLKILMRDGKVLFGTIDSYLLFRMTGKFYTEPSNASRTLLMNLESCQWDEDLLKLFSIPKNALSEIKPTAGVFGHTKNFFDLPDGIPVASLVGDQQAALFGQACFEIGSAKCTYGTGAFILTNIGSNPLFSKHKLLTSVGWMINNHKTYVLEGSSFIAGACVQWIRDGLNLIETSTEIESLAKSVDCTEGVVFVPALSGLSAPHWVSQAKGMIAGLTRGTTKAHLARAALEGIAYSVSELVYCMEKDGKKIKTLKVDGGASQNDLLMQMQSDFLGKKIIRPVVFETTALGAALLAGLGIGLWKNISDIQKSWKKEKEFLPTFSPSIRRRKQLEWDKVISAVKLLAE